MPADHAPDGPRVPTAPHRDSAGHGIALLIIDMISPLDGCDPAIVESAGRVARSIGKLRDDVAALGLPIIYVNDNFGEWHSEKGRIVERALAEDSAGRDIARLLAPRDEDYFIIKPQFSGFYATNLPVLLPKLGVTRLILTGVAADICVLFTAADAHMRDYDIWIPEDTVASEDADRTRWALDIASNAMAAEIAPIASLTLASWQERLEKQRADSSGTSQ